MKLPRVRVFEISFDIPIPENFKDDYGDFAIAYMNRWIQAFVNIYQARPSEALIASNKNRITITIFENALHHIESQLRWVFEQQDAFNVRSGFRWL